MRRLLLTALAVVCSTVTALAGEIPNPSGPAPEGAQAVLVDGLWYWLLHGVLTLIT